MPEQAPPPSSTPDLDVAVRILELMILTAWADGKVEGSEALSIQQQVAAHPVLKQVRNMAGISKQVRARMAAAGLETVLREVAGQWCAGPTASWPTSAACA